MINYSKSNTQSDLSGILELQKENLPGALTKEEISSQGFVTVTHSYEELKELNDIEKHVIAKDGDTVIAYLLAMTQISRFSIPILKPMFELFSLIPFAGKMVSECNYIVVGQVCVSKGYRGQGILDNCYSFYKDCYQSSYDFAITEIAAGNTRSLNAHKRIGFKEVYTYKAPDLQEWVVVLWEWN